MKASLAFGIIITMACRHSFAQTTAEKDVMKPIDNLFLGMKKGDSALVRSVFAKQVNFATIHIDKTGKVVLQSTLSSDFLKAVGTPHSEPWNELIWETEIRIDGNLAQVWAKFAFYFGRKFSHCGIDAFQLFKGADGSWKIFNLSYTHQKEACHVPAEVAARLN